MLQMLQMLHHLNDAPAEMRITRHHHVLFNTMQGEALRRLLTIGDCFHLDAELAVRICQPERCRC